MAGFNGGHGGAEVKPVIGAVRQHEIFSAGAPPDLAGNEIVITAAAESAIPGLDHEFKFLRQLVIKAHPLALDDAAIERRRRLLILSVEGPASHANALAIQKRFWQTRGPEEVAVFLI